MCRHFSAASRPGLSKLATDGGVARVVAGEVITSPGFVSHSGLNVDGTRAATFLTHPLTTRCVSYHRNDEVGVRCTTVAMDRLYTIGHSNRTYAELVAALAAWDVETLVDIRHFTRARANPQFNASVLARRLPRDGIAYVTMSDLGGRRGKSKLVDPTRNAGWQNAAFKNYADYAETPEFQTALTTLLRRAARSRCAIMCAEVLWWRCHRRIVTDYALTRGFAVFHIFTATKLERAKRTPFARLDRRTRTLRYPAATGARRAARAASRGRPASRGAARTPRAASAPGPARRNRSRRSA